MPFLFVLPFVGVVALVAFVAHAGSSKASARPRPVATHQFELDRGMPEDLVHQVLAALVQDSDAARLEAFARSLAAKYPLAASELRGRAAEVIMGNHASPHVDASTSSLRGSSPDTSETAVTLQAAMRAYAQETDPVELQGFAASLRERYPTASLLLASKAHDLGAAGAAAAHVVPPSPSLASAPSVARTYEVHAGDTPTRIAEKITGEGKRWPELVEANPTKPKVHDGSFASLEPGERLALPASWSGASAHATPHSASHAAAEVAP